MLKGLNITDAPERIQRKLYDALRLEVHYERPEHARIKITLTDHGANALAALHADGTAHPHAHEARTPPGARTPTVAQMRRVRGILAPELEQCADGRVEI